MTSGVYAITCRTNDRRYVGSSANIPNRWSRHRSELRRGAHKNPHLQNAWNKYGEDAFEFIVLEECAIEALLEREQHHLDVTPDCYNYALITGTRRGVPQSPETRAKISASLTGIKRSPETRAKMSAAMKGHTHSAGRILTSEHRAKIAAAHQGMPKPWLIGNKHAAGNSPSLEAREKMGAPHRGVPKSDETKRRMSEAAHARVARQRLEKAAKEDHSSKT